MRVLYFILLNFLVSFPTVFAQTKLYIIGTEHEQSELINSDSLLNILSQINPDVILCELESKYFTENYQLNIDKYPDLLSTNENISVYIYQQETDVNLRPYEIDGRNEYYASSNYFQKATQIFSNIDKAYKANTLSTESVKEWEIFIESCKMFDISRQHTIYEINSPLFVTYSHIKNSITYETLTSITARDFPEFHDSAIMISNYWNNRNIVMATNIKKYCEEFKGKTIIVLCGQAHKYDLQRLLSNSEINIIPLKHPELNTFNDPKTPLR